MANLTQIKFQAYRESTLHNPNITLAVYDGSHPNTDLGNLLWSTEFSASIVPADGELYELVFNLDVGARRFLVILQPTISTPTIHDDYSGTTFFGVLRYRPSTTYAFWYETVWGSGSFDSFMEAATARWHFQLTISGSTYYSTPADGLDVYEISSFSRLLFDPPEWRHHRVACLIGPILEKPYNPQPPDLSEDVSPSSVVLQWDCDGTPTHYIVDVSAYDLDWQYLGSVVYDTTTDKFYDLSGLLLPNHIYLWRVTAVYPEGNVHSSWFQFTTSGEDTPLPHDPAPAHEGVDVRPLTEWLSWKPADGMLDQRVVFDFASGTLNHQFLDQVLGYTNEVDPVTGRSYVNIKNILSSTQWPLYRNETFKWRVDTKFSEEGDYEIGTEWEFTTPDFPSDLQPWPENDATGLWANIPYLSITVPTDAVKVEFWKDSSDFAAETLDKLSEIEITDVMRAVGDDITLVSLRQNWTLPDYFTWPLTGCQTRWHCRIHWNSK